MPCKDLEKRRAYDREYRKKWQIQNREAYLAKRKRYRLKHREKLSTLLRLYHLKSYGLTEDDYILLSARQNNCCAVCKSAKHGGRKSVNRFQIDHNHETGAVRGLLCTRCNRGLGLLGDNIEMVEKAFLYLKKGYITLDKNLQSSKNSSAPRSRRYNLQYYYGVSPEFYDLLLEQQNGVCAVCSTNKPGNDHKYFSIDHDHNSGNIRGLLCNNCNRGIGLLGESINNVENALNYLKGGR